MFLFSFEIVAQVVEVRYASNKKMAFVKVVNNSGFTVEIAAYTQENMATLIGALSCGKDKPKIDGTVRFFIV